MKNVFLSQSIEIHTFFLPLPEIRGGLHVEIEWFIYDYGAAALEGRKRDEDHEKGGSRYSSTVP